MNFLDRTIVVLLALSSGMAQAHPGHGEATELHWHAADAWGWALALVVAGAAWWRLRK